MGRKSTAKSKEKRLQRKEEQRTIGQSMTIVNNANKLADPMEPFPAFRKFNKNDLDLELYVKRAPELDEATKTWAFDLTKKNMLIKYEASWGWNDSKKTEELMDDTAYFLIAQNVNDKKPVGFSNFRFDIEEGVEVLYCYEIQLESEVFRKGLGKFMMQILELMAFKNNMKKVMLTVLRNNEFSQFFKALNYELDDISPKDDDEDVAQYEILCKYNRRLLSPEELARRTSPQGHGHSHEHGHGHGHAHGHGHCCGGHHHHHMHHHQH